MESNWLLGDIYQLWRWQDCCAGFQIPQWHTLPQNSKQITGVVCLLECEPNRPDCLRHQCREPSHRRCQIFLKTCGFCGSASRPIGFRFENRLQKHLLHLLRRWDCQGLEYEWFLSAIGPSQTELRNICEYNLGKNVLFGSVRGWWWAYFELWKCERWAFCVGCHWKPTIQ